MWIVLKYKRWNTALAEATGAITRTTRQVISMFSCCLFYSMEVISEHFILILFTCIDDGWTVEEALGWDRDVTLVDTQRHMKWQSQTLKLYFLQRCFIFNSGPWHMSQLCWLVTQQQQRPIQNVNPCINSKRVCGPNKQATLLHLQNFLILLLTLSSSFHHRWSLRLVGSFSSQEPQTSSES